LKLTAPAPQKPAPAWAALVVGLAYAAVSAYWAVGGTWLLDAVGGSFERWGRSGGAGVVLLLSVVVVIKVVAAVLPLLVVYGVGPSSTRRAVRWLAWADGLILTVYGLVLTAAGLAIQAGIVPAASHANHRALEWHAYLWDPWFLVWGLLAIVALRRTPPIRIGQTASSPTWLR
jgi:hypothetical protein